MTPLASPCKSHAALADQCNDDGMSRGLLAPVPPVAHTVLSKQVARRSTGMNTNSQHPGLPAAPGMPPRNVDADAHSLIAPSGTSMDSGQRVVGHLVPLPTEPLHRVEVAGLANTHSAAGAQGSSEGGLLKSVLVYLVVIYTVVHTVCLLVGLFR